MELFDKEGFTNTLRKNKKFMAFGIALFVMGIILGYVGYLYLSESGYIDEENTSDTEEMLDHPLLRGMKEKFSFFEKLNTAERIIFLFLNNLMVSLLAIFFGAILVLFPVFVAFLNGFLIGLISGTVLNSEGIKYLFAALIPHGIFEIPAILISVGLGLKLGYLILHTLVSILRSRPTKDAEIKSFFKELRSVIVVIVLLLAIAAFVEALITPAVITMVGG
ncbi:MAG: stage II sporulation protein M [Euryarchaeota archaeon]|nr:stage II sporulation protein M [Euryarchaeota archaeon]